MHGLTFRVTGRQRRALLIMAVIVGAVPVAMAVVAIVVLGGPVAPFAISLGLTALSSSYACAWHATSYTECTPTGICARGLGRRQDCLWTGVRYISAMNRHRIRVTTTNGTSFWLGAPMNGRLVRDPEFAEKAEQITKYWQWTLLGWHGDDEGAARLGLSFARQSDSDRRLFDIPWKAPPEWPEDPPAHRVGNGDSGRRRHEPGPTDGQ